MKKCMTLFVIENIFQMFFLDELRFNYYLPKLNDYIKNTPQGKIDFFLKSVEDSLKMGRRK